jgi:hypothetical protein
MEWMLEHLWIDQAGRTFTIEEHLYIPDDHRRMMILDLVGCAGHTWVFDFMQSML